MNIKMEAYNGEMLKRKKKRKKHCLAGF